jgi:hypothetical protein
VTDADGAGLGWADLVDAATVGLSRRPLPGAGGIGLSGPAGAYGEVLDGGDSAASLLDAAALVSAARRAGVRAAEGVRGPDAAEPDTARELPPRAAEVVRRAMVADPGVLADLLEEAARRGYRGPAPLLPALLDLAGRDTGLRPAVAGVLGQRGRWLARYRPDWQRVAEAGVPPVPDDPRVWLTGRRDERVGYLTQLRARDPVGARELLAAGWDRETGDDRALLLGVLTAGLAAGDEPFLAAALGDRKGSVRAEAARLLGLLPESAFNRRAAERAAGLLRIERHALRRRLVAEAPDDGTLAEVIGAAALGLWEERFGLEAAQIVALPVAGRRVAEVQAGWRTAAVREARSEWAEALLVAGPEALRAGDSGGPDVTGGNFGWSGSNGGSGTTGVFGGRGSAGVPGGRGTGGWRDPAHWRRPAGWVEDAALAAVLTPEARARRGAALLAGVRPGSAAGMAAITEVAGYPGPWPEPLARAVLDLLRQSARMGPGRAAGSLLAAAGRNLPTTGPADYAAALTELADAGPPAWAPLLRRAAGAITARRTFMEEIG